MDRLRLMTSLVSIVRAGSFAGAARKLGVSPSLLTKHINQLEETLGIQILNRDSHNISLTDIGSEYYNLCVHFLDDIKRAEESVIERDRKPHGILRILSPAGFGSLFMGSALADFQDAYPDIRVSVHLWGQPIRPSDVIGHSFDLVIRTTPPADSSLIVRRIAAFQMVVCAAPEYLSSYGEPAIPSDLSQHRCLYYATNPDKRWKFHGPKGQITVRLPDSLLPQTNSLAILRDMVIRGKGIGLLAEYGVYEAIRDGVIRRIMNGYSAGARELYVLFPRSKFLPLKVRLFVEFFAARFKHPPWEAKVSGKDCAPESEVVWPALASGKNAKYSHRQSIKMRGGRP